MTKIIKDKLITQNKRARFDYFIEESMEAGIVLKGSEVKSLRQGKSNINDSHAAADGEEIFLHNSYIAEYEGANRFNHRPRRPRKLLLRKREVRRLMGLIQKKGVTLVPLSFYFNPKGIAKVELGLATGKKKHDKRATEKERDWKREKQRIFKGLNQ